MKDRTPKIFNFFDLYDRMVIDMDRGKKLQINGNRYRKGTIAGYRYVRKNLFEFCIKRKFELRIRSVKSMTKRTLTVEKNYWKKFHRKFSDFMYKEKGAYDNYVGLHFKIIRAFFNYLLKELLIDTGGFHKQLFVPKEDIPVIVLSPERLNFLIYDKAFEANLCKRLQKIKDIFVFGCTVALRYSDLKNLKYSNILNVDNHYYLSVRSQKTKTYTQVKLPDYAVEIVKKYRKKSDYILPVPSATNINRYSKELIELAGWTEHIGKQREKRGELKEVVKGKSVHRFCDLVTAHTMRRTAITTMLTLGMPEYVVRSISGHTPGSKEFFKYLSLAQVYKDREVDIMHEKLRLKYSENIS